MLSGVSGRSLPIDCIELLYSFQHLEVQKGEPMEDEEPGSTARWNPSGDTP